MCIWDDRNFEKPVSFFDDPLLIKEIDMVTLSLIITWLTVMNCILIKIIG